MILSIIKGSFGILLFKVIGAVCLLLTNVIVANSLGIGAVGELAYLVSLLMLSSLFGRLGLDIYVLKIASYSSRYEISLLVFTSILVAGLSSIIFSAIYYAFDDVLLIKMTSHRVVLPLLFFINTLYSILPECIRGMGFPFEYAFLRNFIINFVVFTLSSVVIYSGYDFDVVLIYAVANVVALVMFLSIYRRKDGYFVAKLIPLRTLPSLLKESMLMSVGAIFVYLISGFGPLLLSIFYSKEQIGTYSIVLQLTLVFTLVATSSAGYVSPFLAKTNREGKIDEFRKYYIGCVVISLCILIPIFFIYLLFGKLILSEIFTISDPDAYRMLMVISLSLLIGSCVGPKFNALNMTDNANTLTKIISFFGMSGFIVSFFVAKEWGVYFYAVSTSIISVTISVVAAFMVNKKFSIIRRGDLPA